MTLDTLLEGFCLPNAKPDINSIRTLIAALRPRHAHDIELATRNLRALTYLLATRPHLAAALRNTLGTVIGTRRLVHLFTDVGILENQGFFGELWKRINHKWLPPKRNDDYLKDVFSLIFDHRDDWRWVCGVDDSVWAELLCALNLRRSGKPLRDTVRRELLTAIQVLSYRITAIGLEPELVRNHPSIERFESPFLRQNAETIGFVGRYQAWMGDRRQLREDSKQIDVLLDQCETVVEKIRRHAATDGVSISLTRLVLRLTQSIARMRLLLQLVDPVGLQQTRTAGIGLFKTLVIADNAKWSIRNLFQTNTELLALQVTERASRTGEHYVTHSRAEWLDMFRSASGAGFIVGFMATLKVLAAKLALAPFGYALLYSLNYSFGFMLVHVLHFTIATKQPAMTAAAIATAIDQGRQKLQELVDLIICVLRSQFIAIIGNVALAMPTAYVIAWIWYFATGHHLAEGDKVARLLHELDPVHSLALPHAAIAGVCLFLSGLISGYYDNKAAYNEIPGRLAQLGWLRRLLGEKRMSRVAAYIGDNLGALAGNFFFGIMLGSIGTLGGFFGIPADIRHITFSSANFAFALVGAGHQLTAEQWILSLLGIVLIGITNLLVSFILALAVALRSRGIGFYRGGNLLLMVIRRFLRSPREFFLPPAQTHG
ncbi:MAG: site-specific recombinase [Proteobacteria bacterium]|nr:site-specific recombinase [Pseudomonadota bacterium]HQR03127.1 site-specific recombinase [Rhodocyclaceae bacterium]